MVSALALGGLLLISAARPAVLWVIAIQTAVSLAAALALAQQVWHFLVTKHQPDASEEAREEQVRPGDLGKVAHRLPLILMAALPFIGADVLASFYTQSSPAILGAVSQTALAQYKIAFTLATAPYVIPTMVFMVALPFLSDTNTHPRDYALAVRALALGALAYGLVLLVAIPLAAPLVTAIYGPDYAEAVPLLRAMSAMPLLKSFSFLSVAVMLSRNRQRLRVALQVGVVCLSVIGGLVVIPKFGAAGAAGLAVTVEVALCAAYALGAYAAWRGKP
jgi:O-antigen/teichoic acid export membrane protein